ncbi:UDP-2,4-diacetamido-2,4,6-trideoxy-beta-L-altropyranose hydrolase [Maribacter sp. TH_r10]|uniref:UDP-2,4-diacetamido-2,4, 6-trideoxy-beta-L-altropyranose hydrolase n=1 Tax=Maribacter sp. TH_r10 TaxID=3082086 RepID=UPI002952FA79|nr:UDP-2,4-diacetamido-2,4,6-trideoxy-beta-L-altropyranose hydrolase [Maribacter sp. TH_r10]MDV7137590.1 UDP-2,4-diacetamido-2,4,6-trideoxy-beta-L-altropyranose hydrolase [Maribacter sp. TH_r10]
MTKKIIFRADGNSETGLGHLFRLFALIEIFKNEYDYVFVTKESTLMAVIPEKYNVDIIPNSVSYVEEPDWLTKHYPSNKCILVLDGYQFNSNYQKKIKHSGYKLMYIDDLADEHMYADLVVNHSPHARIEQYTRESYTEFAFGTAYAILRPSFLKKPILNKELESLNTAFVCFGGADKYNFTFKIVQELLNIAQVQVINVVVGSAYQHTELFQIEKLNPKVRVFRNLNEQSLYSLMNTCTFAIAPTSTIIFELISVNMYLVSGYYVDNQKNAYYEFERRNAIKGIGDFHKYQYNYLNKHLSGLTVNDIQKQILSQKDLIDGKQKSRFLTLMKKIN